MNEILKNLKNRSGIYLITNVVNGKKYVGSAKDIHDRLYSHVYLLRKNKEHNAHFQSAWNKYGEDVFIWTVLEYCDEDIRFSREQYYLDVIKPEYNKSLNVIANYGRKVTEDTRQKISDKLKLRYKLGEIKTYRQEHNWIKIYCYDIKTLNLVKCFNCVADALKYFKMRTAGLIKIEGKIINNMFISNLKFEYKHELYNYIMRRSTYQGNDAKIEKKYLISEHIETGKIVYHTLSKKCAEYVGISRSCILKRPNANKENPYISPKQPNFKIYFSSEFIPYSKDTVLDGEPPILLSGKIEESPEVDNIELTN